MSCETSDGGGGIPLLFQWLTNSISDVYTFPKYQNCRIIRGNVQTRLKNVSDYPSCWITRREISDYPCAGKDRKFDGTEMLDDPSRCLTRSRVIHVPLYLLCFFMR